jgi:glycosyltransferase involved in cell wall biosynthesis
MRLNWFTPLPPARTDIANYSLRVLPALLARVDEVKVWSSHPDYDPSRLPPGVLHAAADRERLPWPELNFREHTVYQVGNDHRFHGAIFRHLEQHGGIVVLHDANVHEAQRMRLLDSPGGSAAYLARLGQAGGDAATHAGRLHLQGSLPLETLLQRYPLTESVLAGAHGVVVHNPEAAAVARALTDAPVACLPLPFSDPAEWPTPVPRQPSSDRPLRLIMFGFLHGPNRRLTSVLKALACCQARGRFELDLFGELAPEAGLDRHLRELSLTEQVRFHGFVSTPRMRELMESADLALNLRHPTRGEASGSLLRIWSHALPCVVSDSGTFATLPADSVIRLPADDGEILALADVLDQFAADPESFAAIGRRGRAQLAAAHTPEAYVEGFLRFLPLVEAYRGRAYLEHYLPRIAHGIVAELPARPAQEYWIRRLAGIFAEGFGASSGAEAEPSSAS